MLSPVCALTNIMIVIVIFLTTDALQSLRLAVDKNIWIPAFADMTQFCANELSGLRGIHFVRFPAILRPKSLIGRGNDKTG